MPICPRDPRAEERQLQDQPLQTGQLFHRGSKSAKGQVTLPNLTKDINYFKEYKISISPSLPPPFYIHLSHSLSPPLHSSLFLSLSLFLSTSLLFITNSFVYFQMSELGICPRGDNCSFAHSVAELRQKTETNTSFLGSNSFAGTLG